MNDNKDDCWGRIQGVGKYFGRVEHFPKPQPELLEIFNFALLPHPKWWKNPIKFIRVKLEKRPKWTLVTDLTQSKIVQAARQEYIDARNDRFKTNVETTAGQEEQFQTIYMNQPQSKYLSDKDRYERDPIFHHLVSLMEQSLMDCKFTPEDIHVAARFAEYKIQLNERNGR